MRSRHAGLEPASRLLTREFLPVIASEQSERGNPGLERCALDCVAALMGDAGDRFGDGKKTRRHHRA